MAPPTTPPATVLPPTLFFSWDGGGEHLHGIESALIFGPAVTFKFVFLHLFFALSLGRINNHILGNRSSGENQKTK
jgi:hypothetical protein